MLTLSVRQPWVWAIFHGGKDIENREWIWYHGISLPKRILIHASGTMTEFEYLTAAIGIREVLRLQRGAGAGDGTADKSEPPPAKELPRGCIVGAVTVVACHQQHTSPWFAGPFGFELTDPVALPTPIPCTGKRGLWHVPEDIGRAVRRSAKKGA